MCTVTDLTWTVNSSEMCQEPAFGSPGRGYSHKGTGTWGGLGVEEQG